MFGKNKTSAQTPLEREQHEIIEKAQRRIKQKKGVYRHFVFFLAGSLLFIVLNKVIKVGEPSNWFVWAVSIWFFIFLIHLFNVYLLSSFLDQEWERQQREKLIGIQKRRIAEIQSEIDKEFPLPSPPEQNA